MKAQQNNNNDDENFWGAWSSLYFSSIFAHSLFGLLVGSLWAMYFTLSEHYPGPCLLWDLCESKLCKIMVLHYQQAIWASGLRKRSLARTQENNLPDPSFLLLIHNPQCRKEIKYLNTMVEDCKGWHAFKLTWECAVSSHHLCWSCSALG